MSKSAGKFKLPKSAGNSNSPNAEKCGKVQIEIQFHKYKKKNCGKFKLYKYQKVREIQIPNCPKVREIQIPQRPKNAGKFKLKFHKC